MGNFRKNNQFGSHGGGGRSFDRGDSRGGPRFKNFAARGFGQDVPMHQATCAQCGKMCEVPFRPNGKKPVYCKECFGGASGNERGERDSRAPARDFPRREFAPRQPFVPNDARMARPPQHDDSKQQFELLNTKLDRLIRAVEALPRPAVPAVASEKTADEARTLSKVVADVVKKNAVTETKKAPAKKKTLKK